VHLASTIDGFHVSWRGISENRRNRNAFHNRADLVNWKLFKIIHLVNQAGEIRQITSIDIDYAVLQQLEFI